MRGSSLTTFLMFLPLIAIPLLAIFGVPEFTPVKASSPTEPFGNGTSIAGLDAARQTSAAGKSGGVFDPPDTAGKRQSETSKVADDPFSKSARDRLGEWAMPPDKPGENQQDLKPPLPPQPKQQANRPATPAADAVATSWRQARQRLNRLGVSKFLLQPGATADQFHFSCLYSTPDNPRVTRRFEAESDEPLKAVQDVLRQIESRR